MSAIGTRRETARVAFFFACSMSCSRSLGSVLATFRPEDRLRAPVRNARVNSRWVCCRPFGVAYQSASSASDLNLEVLVDLRGILLPFIGIHIVSCHGAQESLANREHHDQVPGQALSFRKLSIALRLSPSQQASLR